MNRPLVFRPIGSASVAVAACCILIFTVFLSLSHASSDSSEGLSSKVAASIGSVSREKGGAVVRIRCSDAHGQVNGTGFYIDPTGTICTLIEIVRGGSNITILKDGREYPASLSALDARSGVAFLKVDVASTPRGVRSFIPLRSVTNATALTPVLGIGVPMDDSLSLSLGMITGSISHEGENYFCVPHLLAGISLSEGEGGSPILDLSGGLIGMVVSGTSKTGEFRILPSGAIEKLQRDLLRFGKFSPGWVGAVVEEAAVPQGASRTRIASVEFGSPAEVAGLKGGDMILSIAGRNITSPEEVLAASFYLHTGESVGISILRGGKVRTVRLLCSAPPGMMDSSDVAEPAAR